MKAKTKLGIIFIIIIIMFYFLPASIQPETIDSPYINWFIDRCALHNVPLEIVLAVAIVESNIEMVTSNHNSNGSLDCGIMQLNDRYLKYHTEQFWYKDRIFNVNDPKDNIEMGILILKNLYRQTNSWEKSIQAYNVGCSKLKRNPDIGKAYLVKVINVLNTLQLKRM